MGKHLAPPSMARTTGLRHLFASLPLVRADGSPFSPNRQLRRLMSQWRWKEVTDVDGLAATMYRVPIPPGHTAYDVMAAFTDYPTQWYSNTINGRIAGKVSPFSSGSGEHKHKPRMPLTNRYEAECRAFENSLEQQGIGVAEQLATANAAMQSALLEIEQVQADWENGITHDSEEDAVVARLDDCHSRIAVAQQAIASLLRIDPAKRVHHGKGKDPFIGGDNSIPATTQARMPTAPVVSRAELNAAYSLASPKEPQWSQDQWFDSGSGI